MTVLLGKGRIYWQTVVSWLVKINNRPNLFFCRHNDEHHHHWYQRTPPLPPSLPFSNRPGSLTFATWTFVIQPINFSSSSILLYSHSHFNVLSCKYLYHWANCRKQTCRSFQGSSRCLRHVYPNLQLPCSLCPVLIIGIFRHDCYTLVEGEA